VNNGCARNGFFAGLNGKQSLDWVKANNIVAVHSRFFPTYRGKTLRLRDPSTQNTVDAKVVDLCSDNDCAGCCTRNMATTGFLLDVEYYTIQRLYGRTFAHNQVNQIPNKVIEWMLLD
jgi:hypothetical protein